MRLLLLSLLASASFAVNTQKKARRSLTRMMAPTTLDTTSVTVKPTTGITSIRSTSTTSTGTITSSMGQDAQCKSCVLKRMIWFMGRCQKMTLAVCQKQRQMIMDAAPMCYSSTKDCASLCPNRGDQMYSDGKCYKTCVIQDDMPDVTMPMPVPFPNGRRRLTSVAWPGTITTKPVTSSNGCARGEECKFLSMGAFFATGVCVPGTVCSDKCTSDPCCDCSGGEEMWRACRPQMCPNGEGPTPIKGKCCEFEACDGVEEKQCSDKCADNPCCECHNGFEAWMSCSMAMCPDGFSYPKSIPGTCCGADMDSCPPVDPTVCPGNMPLMACDQAPQPCKEAEWMEDDDPCTDGCGKWVGCDTTPSDECAAVNDGPDPWKVCSWTKGCVFDTTQGKRGMCVKEGNTACPAVMCKMACPNGWAQDPDTGCDICKCAPVDEYKCKCGQSCMNPTTGMGGQCGADNKTCAQWFAPPQCDDAPSCKAGEQCCDHNGDCKGKMAMTCFEAAKEYYFEDMNHSCNNYTKDGCYCRPDPCMVMDCMGGCKNGRCTDHDEICVKEPREGWRSGVGDNNFNHIVSDWEECALYCGARPQCDFWNWRALDSACHTFKGEGTFIETRDDLHYTGPPCRVSQMDECAVMDCMGECKDGKCIDMVEEPCYVNCCVITRELKDLRQYDEPRYRYMDSSNSCKEYSRGSSTLWKVGFSSLDECTAECVEEDSGGCPEVMCDMWCEGGWAQGADGCDICECKPQETGECTEESGMCPMAMCMMPPALQDVCTYSEGPLHRTSSGACCHQNCYTVNEAGEECAEVYPWAFGSCSDSKYTDMVAKRFKKALKQLAKKPRKDNKKLDKAEKKLKKAKKKGGDVAKAQSAYDTAAKKAAASGGALMEAQHYKDNCM